MLNGCKVYTKRAEMAAVSSGTSHERTKTAGLQLHHVGGRIFKARCKNYSHIVQELCESRGGRPGLSVLTSLLVSVDVKIYCTVLRHWSQLGPDMSTDI